MNIKDLDLSFGNFYNENIAKENAKKKCRICYGRGCISIQFPKYNAAVKDYCSCVKKKLEKE
tara:strand:+ start:1143 stop:1328 length:186 start_codon:yes stop_codon:yes gene_type:complete